MTDPVFTYIFDGEKDENVVEFDRVALHDQQVTPAAATVILLAQISRHLGDISRTVFDTQQQAEGDGEKLVRELRKVADQLSNIG